MSAYNEGVGTLHVDILDFTKSLELILKIFFSGSAGEIGNVNLGILSRRHNSKNMIYLIKLLTNSIIYKII